MKTFQKAITTSIASAALLFSLATPISAVVSKATPTPSPEPSVTPTIVPVEATPTPPSTANWIITHKKISLGILLVVVAAGYGLYHSGKKGNQAPPENQSKPEEVSKVEEEPSKEDPTPPENTV